MADEQDTLLAALSRVNIPDMDGSLRVSRLLQGATLQLSDPRPRYAHFLRSGTASTSIRMADGSLAAVKLNSGGDLLEIHALLGVTAPESRVTVLIPGEAVRVPFALLKQAFDQDGVFRGQVLAQLGRQSLETEQLSVCNRLHQLEARLARYLLTIQDRCGDATIPMTQEVLSDELGVRRSSVALAAGVHRRSGLLAFRRGRIQILNHAGLEAVSCECYEAIRKMRAEPKDAATVTNFAMPPLQTQDVVHVA